MDRALLISSIGYIVSWLSMNLYIIDRSWKRFRLLFFKSTYDLLLGGLLQVSISWEAPHPKFFFFLAPFILLDWIYSQFTCKLGKVLPYLFLIGQPFL